MKYRLSFLIKNKSLCFSDIVFQKIFYTALFYLNILCRNIISLSQNHFAEKPLRVLKENKFAICFVSTDYTNSISILKSGCPTWALVFFSFTLFLFAELTASVAIKYAEACAINMYTSCLHICLKIKSTQGANAKFKLRNHSLHARVKHE